MNYRYIDSPIGTLTIIERDNALTHLLFGEVRQEGAPSASPLLDQVQQELEEYFLRQRQEFTIPLAPQGTAFQRLAWQGLLTIPYGQTMSYGELAKAIGHPKSFRAVGGANHHNPISIIIPCHRVIGANGSLTGYGGGLEKKIFLLELEQPGSCWHR